MSNKKIQLTDSRGNKIYPITSGEALATVVPVSVGGTNSKTIEEARDTLDIYSKEEVDSKINTTPIIDLSDYSKNTHIHSFTGTEKSVFVTGTYSKTVGVTISSGTGTTNYTPSGSVTILRTQDVKLETDTVNGITNVGSLPSLKEDEEEITDFKVVDVFNSGSKPTRSAVTVTKEGIKSVSSIFEGDTEIVNTEPIKPDSPSTYTPSGIISKPTFSGTISVNSNTTSTNGTKYVEDVNFTGASVSETKSALTSSIKQYLHFSKGTTPVSTAVFKGVSGTISSSGTYLPEGVIDLGSNSTSTGGIKYVDSILNCKAIATGTGTVGISSTAASGNTRYLHGSFSGTSHTIVTGVSGGTSVLTGTQTFAKSVTGSVSDRTLTIGYSSGTVGISSIAASVKTGTYTPSGSVSISVNDTALGGAGVVTSVSGGTASLTGTKTFVIGVSGGTTSTTYKYFHPTFAGTSKEFSSSGTFTPSGIISLTRGSLPSLTLNSTSTNGIGVVTATSSSAGFVSSINGGSVSKTTKYAHPSVTGSVSQPSFIGTDVRLVTTAKGNISNSYTNASKETIYQITNTGSTPSLTTKTVDWVKGSLPVKGSNKTVVTGISTQPSYKGSFAGTGVNLKASVSNSDTTINSSGNYIPDGVIGTAE